MLEEREVPSVSTIAADFSGPAIKEGSTIWFNSALNVSGLNSAITTIYLNHSHINFTAGGKQYSIDVPDAAITFDPATKQATTQFQGGAWQTFTSKGLGDAFLSGVSFVVPPGGLPGKIKNVTWTGNFESSRPGVTVKWEWSAAVYKNFSADYNALGVKPVDSRNGSAYHNSDDAGTAENFKSSVKDGGCGRGKSHSTVADSRTHKVRNVDVAQPSMDLSSLSGYVYADQDISGDRSDADVGIYGVQLTLEGTDDKGNYVLLQVTTDESGFYSFGNLRPGNYTLTETQPSGYDNATNAIGTQGGSFVDQDRFAIQLGTGVKGLNNNFGEVIHAE